MAKEKIMLHAALARCAEPQPEAFDKNSRNGVST